MSFERLGSPFGSNKPSHRIWPTTAVIAGQREDGAGKQRFSLGECVLGMVLPPFSYYGADMHWRKSRRPDGAGTSGSSEPLQYGVSRKPRSGLRLPDVLNSAGFPSSAPSKTRRCWTR